MSDGTVTRAAAEPAPDGVSTPTITHYQQLATELNATLTELIARIPRFESKHPLTADFVRQHARVPADFIATCIAAVEANPELLHVQRFDAIEARDTMQFLEAFRPLVDRFFALARDLKFTMDSRRAKVAADGLQIYAIAKGVARDPGSAVVATHVANMKRDLGRSRPTPRVPATPPPATPAKAA